MTRATGVGALDLDSQLRMGGLTLEAGKPGGILTLPVTGSFIHSPQGSVLSLL